MATLEGARQTDGEHLSALALPRLPCLPTHHAGSAPTQWTPPTHTPPSDLQIWYHIHALHIPVRVFQISQCIYHVWNSQIRRPCCFSWHGWVWMSVASVVDWFSIRIDWTKWAPGSIAGERSDVGWMSYKSGSHMVLLFTCAWRGGWGETVPFIPNYCMK